MVGSLAGGPTGDHDSMSLIDLTAKPPRVVDTIGVLGSTAEGLKISPDSSVVVIVRVTGKTLSRVAEAPIGHWSQGMAFAPDGKTILVGNMVERDYWVFQWDGSSLKDTGQRVKGERRPRRHPHGRQVARAQARAGAPFSKKRSATATCIATPAASADSSTTIRGE